MLPESMFPSVEILDSLLPSAGRDKIIDYGKDGSGVRDFPFIADTINRRFKDKYPERARRMGWEGEVLVSFAVSKMVLFTMLRLLRAPVAASLIIMPEISLQKRPLIEGYLIRLRSITVVLYTNCSNEFSKRTLLMSAIQDNGLILIIYKDKKYLKRITHDQSFHGKGGALNYSDIIGREFGMRFGEYDIYEPTMEDIVMYAFKRETQIIYPKDSFYIRL